MRIAFDYQIFSMQAYGGVSRYFARLAEGFLAYGNVVHLFAPLYINNYLTELPSETIQGRRLNCYPFKSRRILSAYNQFISHSQIAHWRPDVVHETYFAKNRSAPIESPTVITVHDMISELFSEDNCSRDRAKNTKKIAITRADHVICVSENTKKDLIDIYGVSDKKISVVLHGFDHFSNYEQSLYSREAQSKPFLLYVGSRSGYKNFEGFLMSVAASRRLSSDFTVIAFGGGKFTASEVNLIRQLGFSANQVRQINGDDKLLGHLYSTARVFVYPSLYEGFGIPPLEAMAHRCPVISSNTSSMPEVIGNAGEYFNPINTAEMQHAIESVVYSDSRVSELIALGIKRLEQFSWAKCAEQTLAVYSSLL